MACRIEESVVRGEIDNRVRDRVTGRLWLAGRAEPITLDLAGNAWRDLAGRRLEFVNPRPLVSERAANLAGAQSGVIGDCTASRKVKVPDVSMDELMKRVAQRQSFPWHWGNSLYLEWFSSTNGRVVVESADFQLTIGEGSAWEMTVAEEDAQRQANAAALRQFLAELSEAAPLGGTLPAGARRDEDRNDVPGETEADAERFFAAPLTEEEAEKMQEDSDVLADRINRRVEREGAEHFTRILKEELERRRHERGEAPLTPEDEAEREAWINEMNQAAAEAATQPASEADSFADREHPLAREAFELSLRLHADVEDRGWIPVDAPADHAVADLVGSLMSAAAKLAGALDGDDWPPPLVNCAAALVRLKRAHAHLEHAWVALAFCREHSLASPVWLAAVDREICALLEQAAALIVELRARLGRGFD